MTPRSTSATARGAAGRGVVLLVVLAVVACRPPAHLILTVEDPQQLCGDWATLAVGTDPTTLVEVTPTRHDLPVTVTVTLPSADERTLWGEVRDAQGLPLGRGTTAARFERRGTPTATIALGRPCAADQGCDDQSFCTGVELCVDTICTAGTGPCAASFDCVSVSCVELGAGAGSCAVVADHALCPTGAYCNPVQGCLPGRGCHDAGDCDDGYRCNGDEQCINLVCVGGTPLATDDGIPCTLDGCSEDLGVFHAPQPAFDGVPCGASASARRICLAAGGGCVTSRCGDGFVDAGATPPEACDDGPANADPWALDRRCNASCAGWAPYCGDNQLDVGYESCDDGDSRDTGNGCSATCQDGHVCGDGVQQILFEDCDDGDADECNGCRTDCARGCICAAPNPCAGANWCDAGRCVPCAATAHCGPSCVACAGETPVCGGASVGCECEASPAPHGSCSKGAVCSGGACCACDTLTSCGQDCLSCGGTTPLCGGAESGCVTADCAGLADFTLCAPSGAPSRAYNICIAGSCESPGCGTSACNPPYPSFARADLEPAWQYPDTNERVCYSDSAPIACPASGATFYGQDAQYGWDTHSPPNPRFARVEDVVGEPAVQDSVTGMVWQGCLGGLAGSGCTSGGAYLQSWSVAVGYCDSLVWGGYADWRLPDFHELFSLADLGRYIPALDAAAFAGMPTDVQIWSATTSATDPLNAWAFWVLDGYSFEYLKSNAHSVLCARGAPPVGAAAARFTRSGATPVVTDAKTGLMWQGCVDGKTGSTCTGTAASPTWQAALTYCEGLSWATYTDWRLPNLTELWSIVDTRLASPAIDPTAFPQTPTAGHWTASSHYADSGQSAWTVDFANGGSDRPGKGNPAHVRCVRLKP
ncbi:MAG: DUF1566 domain-containing protein [Deltaproteobacteria bacterium]|nr:DUF1566 domain-containing protein [Deltaproteobacteria bacterium]